MEFIKQEKDRLVIEGSKLSVGACLMICNQELSFPQTLNHGENDQIYAEYESDLGTVVLYTSHILDDGKFDVIISFSECEYCEDTVSNLKKKIDDLMLFWTVSLDQRKSP